MFVEVVFVFNTVLDQEGFHVYTEDDNKVASILFSDKGGHLVVYEIHILSGYEKNRLDNQLFSQLLSYSSKEGKPIVSLLPELTQYMAKRK